MHKNLTPNIFFLLEKSTVLVYSQMPSMARLHWPEVGLQSSNQISDVCQEACYLDHHHRFPVTVFAQVGARE